MKRDDSIRIVGVWIDRRRGICLESFNFRLYERVSVPLNRFFSSIGSSWTVANKLGTFFGWIGRMHTQNRRVPRLIDSGVAGIT